MRIVQTLLLVYRRLLDLRARVCSHVQFLVWSVVRSSSRDVSCRGIVRDGVRL